MDEPIPAVAGDRANRLALTSVVCGILSLVWVFIHNELGERHLLLALPSVVIAVLAITFASWSIRRTTRVHRVAAIIGLVLGIVGTGISGLYVVMMSPFMLLAIMSGFAG